MAWVFPYLVFSSLMIEIFAPWQSSLFNYPFSWEEPEYQKPPQTNWWDKNHQSFKEDPKKTHSELSKKAFKKKEQLWPKAAVIYKTEDSVGCPFSDKCHMLMEAMSLYTKRGTCIRFKEWSGEDDYVSVFVNPEGGACWSLLGRVGGEQKTSLGEHCWETAIVVHELAHVLSFYDEMNRADREDHVIVHWENIQPQMKQAFTKAEVSESNLLEEPFDYKSIMMYDNTAFSVDGYSHTLDAKTGERLTHVVHRPNLSDLDVHKINKLYRCLNTGGKQKPRFPDDVICPFDEDNCGFKGIDQHNWSWSPAGSAGSYSSRGGAGELQTDFRGAGNNVGRVWSINFHGLSPSDKERGPNGCAVFSYSISANGRVSMQLFQTILDSPQQLFYDPGDATELWSQRKATSDQWFRALVTVPVTKPFMLTFQSEFGQGTTQGSIRLDDFELNYTPCSKKKSVDPTPLKRKSRGGSSGRFQTRLRDGSGGGGPNGGSTRTIIMRPNGGDPNGGGSRTIIMRPNGGDSQIFGNRETGGLPRTLSRQISGGGGGGGGGGPIFLTRQGSRLSDDLDSMLSGIFRSRG